ncbi:MAG: deferrochelatase/peroxidase EfeB [Actinobacteria bacterium]|nr:deferrochelatase/peroxidase EfeB [Actinomycetota bacterium]
MSDVRPGGLSRRRFFGLAGAGTAGVIAAGAAGGVIGRATAEEPAGSPGALAADDAVPFHGPHQAGIATAVQDRMHTAAFDVTTTDRAALVRLLRRWTEAAALMTAGEPVGPGGALPAVGEAPPDDTGEALGLPAARLTLTFGVGPGLFTEGGRAEGADRFGLAARRPAALVELPGFAGDRLDPARSGGDLVVQACADDPQVAVHAIRNLARIAFGTATVRWSQLGFGRTSSTTPAQATPRNLFGFKDGTNNVGGDDEAALREHVWVDAAADGAPAWVDGGTYLVARRIAMRVETWDRASLADQERITGRTKGTGAPLHPAVRGRPDDAAGRALLEREPVRVRELPPDSHVALAHPDANAGRKILRRGYSFVDGSDGLGRLDAGLFFVAFCRDPRTQYVPLQAKLSRTDAMAEYLVHTGSGLWAVPPGVRAGEYWAQALLEG